MGRNAIHVWTLSSISTAKYWLSMKEGSIGWNSKCGRCQLRKNDRTGWIIR